jgi:hypothetical protein
MAYIPDYISLDSPGESPSRQLLRFSQSSTSWSPPKKEKRILPSAGELAKLSMYLTAQQHNKLKQHIQQVWHINMIRALRPRTRVHQYLSMPCQIFGQDEFFTVLSFAFLPAVHPGFDARTRMHTQMDRAATLALIESERSKQNLSF